MRRTRTRARTNARGRKPFVSWRIDYTNSTRLEADASTTAVKTTNEVEQYAIKAATENGRNIGAMQLQLANEAIESRAIEKNEADAIKGMTEIEDAIDQEDQAQDEKEERGEEKERSDPYDNAKKIAVVPSLLLCALTAKNPSLLPNVLAASPALPPERAKGYTDQWLA